MQTTATAIDLAQRDDRAIANALKIRYTPLAVDGGEGGRLFDVDGRSYLDLAPHGLWPDWATAMNGCCLP